MKPICTPKLAEFRGWQNDVEYLADEAECKRRSEWQIAQYKKQMREQRTVPLPSWKYFARLFCFWAVATLVLIGAAMWVLSSVKFPGE